MRLGLIGVGPWASKLATAFRECGAEIVAYDRKTLAEHNAAATAAYQMDRANPTPFGAYTSWRGQLTDPNIDALIICAPPDVTTEVALACAKAGKRCVATKPLMWSEVPDGLVYPMPKLPPSGESMSLSAMSAVAEHARQFGALSSALYVDLWRLYSPAWLAMKEELRGKRIDRIDVAFCGNGPFRSFPGVLDYGPHAMAFVYDLLGETSAFEQMTWRKLPTEHGELWEGGFELNGTEVRARIGNGAKEPERWVRVVCPDKIGASFEEPPNPHTASLENTYYVGGSSVASCTKALALRRFCRAFMAGKPSRTLEFSIAGMRVLEKLTRREPE